MKITLLLICFVFAVTHLAQAQQSRKIGLVSGGSRSSTAADAEAFRQGLRDLGYIERHNITIEDRYADGKLARLPELVKELVAGKVDVMVANAPAAVRAAKNATNTIPIVMAHGGDPVAQKFVDSLARPGGNITGLSNFSAELGGKRLELITEAVRKKGPVAVIWNPDAPGPVLSFKELEVAAHALKVQLQSVHVRDPNDFDEAFQAVSRHASGLVVIQDIVTVTHLKLIVELATKYRLPAIYMEADFADAGGLISYGPSQPDMFRRAATYVDKILKGTKPADLPVEQPTKFELVINLKAAQQIGLKIPPSILARANKVIK